MKLQFDETVLSKYQAQSLIDNPAARERLNELAERNRILAKAVTVNARSFRTACEKAQQLLDQVRG